MGASIWGLEMQLDTTTSPHLPLADGVQGYSDFTSQLQQVPLVSPSPYSTFSGELLHALVVLLRPSPSFSALCFFRAFSPLCFVVLWENAARHWAKALLSFWWAGLQTKLFHNAFYQPVYDPDPTHFEQNPAQPDPF